MLTMPKLVSALMIAFLAWIISGLVKAVMPEETNFGHFVELSVVVGLLCGWVVLGRRVNGFLGFGIATGIGLTAMVATVFWTLFLVTGNEVLRLAVDERFDGPKEALLAMFPLGAEYGQYLLFRDTILTIVIGGMVAGFLADLSARYWK
ncbi:TrgA family protein [Pseudooceanicola sp. 216_PA32_1]|uniref:TrgA family protein n=1 Tax=Pseudooceanicola pacificus TaxID=2676438 RepID=A0A844WB19_9RHOB|nr:TrgA family protein [Pseudooceanicola pacificus]MWB77042.1 TrgA family protein [Pseudooceanicola pacificus]